MRAPGRPQARIPRAQRGGVFMRAPGRPQARIPRVQRGGVFMRVPGRPKPESRARSASVSA
jgi:hypothetical protein